jgi:hypothetical protein
MSVAQLSDDVKIVQAITITAGAAGLTNINGTVIDTAGFDGVLFVVQFGAIVATAVTSIKAQQDTVVGMGAAADIAGTNQVVADTDDDKIFFIDIKRALEQFVRVVVSRATANATCSAIAYLYRSRSRPVTHGTGVAGEKFASPVEGVA